MPIGLIRKIAKKLSGKGGDAKPVDPAGAPHAVRPALPPVPGSAAVSRGTSAETWRPGDPVPAAKAESRRPAVDRRSGTSTSRRPAAPSSNEPRPRRAERSRPPVVSKAAVEGASAGAKDEPRTAAGEGSPDASGEAPRRRRSRGGRRRTRKPGDAADEASSPVDESAVAESPVALSPMESPVAEEDSPAVTAYQQPPTPRSPAFVSGKDWTPADYVVEPAEGKLRFQDVDLPDSILHALADMGFQYCTPIQARVLQEVAEGHNVAGKAQTGTGKTAAFLLLTFKQFLQNPMPADRPCGKPRALILAPTRELVIQIVRDAEEIGKYCGMTSVAVYGGADYDRQERELLRTPVDVVAATPGRLLDFRRKGTLDLSAVEVLVIDEADRMLDMGFIPDVRTIIRSTPPKERRRTLLFSATLSEEVMRLAAQWMPDPHVVEIEPDHVAVDTVKQLVYMVRANQKFTVLYNLLRRPNMGRVLVFANRRDQTDRIAFELQRYGIVCEILSGAVDQKKRMRVLDDFRSGKLQIVVATDVAGRGLHVDNIDHVVNFDLPYEAEDYVHRIGRTGRAGAEGTAVSFACEDESFGIPEIEKYIGETMSCQYPEEVLLQPLPSTRAPTYVRPPRSPSTGGRSGGSRSGGSRSSGSYGGGGRPRR